MQNFYCDVLVLMMRFYYVCCISLINFRHLVRDLYVFRWRHVASLNYDFFVKFVTNFVLAFASVFTLTTYMLGYHNGDLEYHLCTGRNPMVHINETLKVLSHSHGEVVQPVWFQPFVLSDPIDLFSTLMIAMLFTLHFRLWHYMNKIQLMVNCTLISCRRQTKRGR